MADGLIIEQNFKFNLGRGSSPTLLKSEIMKHKFYVEIAYNDNSEFHFNVELEGTDYEVMASLTMITRGTLMASSAYRAIAYNEEGFDVCSYII